jgi:hypothetical protein
VSAGVLTAGPESPSFSSTIVWIITSAEAASSAGSAVYFETQHW